MTKRRRRKLARVRGATYRDKLDAATKAELHAHDAMMKALRAVARAVERYELARKRAERYEKLAREESGDGDGINARLDDIRKAFAAEHGFDGKTGAEVVDELKSKT